jgi:phosphatidate cytidylyltransferase
MKEFITRTTTAFFLVIAAYGLIQYVPVEYFSIIWFLIISMGVMELLKLTEPKLSSPTLLFLNGFIIALYFTVGKPDLPLAMIIIIMSSGLFFLFSSKQDLLSAFVRDIGIHYIGVFYLYFPLYYFFLLKKMHPNYLFFLIFVIAIGDSAAYFVGRAIGKHKIYPVASPKKSLEGLIAAIIVAGLSGWGSILLFPVKVDVLTAVITASIIGLISQLSDPLESLFKRSAGKKDSSNLLPGHGGVLDRVDSYIFCAPALYYIIQYLWK